QRGVQGHVIVYPQQPSDIAKVLPPSIEEVVTPICVIFVSSNPPTKEWLQKKAKPLTVCKERVMAALDWLKSYNPLYKDIEINHHVFDSQPSETIFPFHVQHILPSASINATTSSYVPAPQEKNPGDPEPNIKPATEAPDLATIMNPLTTAPILFESVVVMDVEGHASSSKLHQAVIKHMNLPVWKNYLGIPHDKSPVNEFDNPALFPMIYPTLYPYGIGGCEDKRHKTPLAMKTHIKHL
ncbi:hypothetical protein B0H10DRAFT_1679138, partial [Mycena sp. CBHHK59/15]